MRCKPYANYKPSGVDWFGHIPAAWEVVPLKRLGDFQAGAGFPDDEQGQEDGDLPFYKVSDMNLPGNELNMISHNNAVSNETAKALRAFIFPSKTIIFAKVGAALLLNKRRILTRPSCVDNNTMGFMPRSCDLRWIYYWMCGLDLGKLANPGAVPSINEGQLREIPIPLPPTEDQEAIGNFLLRETARIDQLIAKKERQIELLQEKRSALISHAVTKGLNPKARMKDSRIEWLGEIPEHWLVMRIKRVAKLESGHTPDKQIAEYWENCTIPWVSLNDTKHLKDNDYIDDTAIHINEKGLANSSARLLPSNAVVFTRDATIGLCAITTRPMAVSQHIIAWLCGADIKPEYLLRVFHAMNQELNRLTMGSTIKTIGMPDVRELVMPVPTLKEQHAIVDYLKKKLGAVGAARTKVEKSVELLREYRTALISAAVTGKIDVREEVA